MSRAVARLRSVLALLRRSRTPEELERAFRLFREVLDGNDRALRIITEMGEVLGGDYLFDVEYVKRAHAELSAEVGRSLHAFHALTRGRYRELRDVAASIDAMIGRVIDDAPPRDLVVFHEDLTPDRAASAGGKNAGLAALRSARLDVPEGFALTTWAFDAFVRHNGLGDRLLALRQLDDVARTPALDELRDLVLRGEVPPELARVLQDAIGTVRARCGPRSSLSVRSSAEGEDGDHSFAGQFATIHNVPPELGAVEEAYRQVIASLFSAKAAAYQAQLGHPLGAMKMAVACMAMVDAAVSGVLYTSNPAGAADSVVIGASWGLGTPVVGGRTDADHLVVRKDGTATIVEERIGTKATMEVLREGSGTEEIDTPEEKRRRRCLDGDQVARLVDAAVVVERHFRSPQDLEWAFDASGRLFFLQARPLRMAATPERPPLETSAASRIPFKRPGIVVQAGSAAGTVHVLESARQLDAVPRGAVLVARHDASDVVRVMPRVAAIVTDTGGAASHMASLSREFGVPTIVNTGDATRVLTPGRRVTVVAGPEGAAVYEGWLAQAPGSGAHRGARMESLREFRRRRYALRLIAPLNLVDPLREDFTPEACRTVHDVLRFMHEKAVTTLVEEAGLGAASRRAVRLELPIPAGISLIDIGGGLADHAGSGPAKLEQVTSVPFRALARGMTHPGVWRSEAVPLTAGDFLSSMLRVPDVASQSARVRDTNVAVVSRDYANVNIKFGYHYAVVDCHCSDTPRKNHVLFRFAGGATDITRRSMRLQFIARVLDAHGFNVATKGDLILGRLANVPRDDLVRVLDQLGRLLAYTRQLDAVLGDEAAAERLAARFMGGVYDPE